MSKLYVCYGSSNEYVQYTGISLLSLLENNYKIIEKVFILDYGISNENKDILQNISSDYKTTVEFIEAESILEKIRQKYRISTFRGSMATYSRAFISYLIPDYVEKLLYIDSDTIVCGSIKDLKEIDMQNYSIASAIGVNQYYRKGKKNYPSSEVQGLMTNNKIYFAMGVVLFDLHNWEKNRCDSLIDDVCKKKKVFEYAEQSLINNALPEYLMMPISLKYNYWGHLYNEKIEEYKLNIGDFYEAKEIRDAIDNPIILHYKGLFYQRPWYDKCTSRMADQYLNFKRKSPWNEEPLFSVENHIEELDLEHKIRARFDMLKPNISLVWGEKAIELMKKILIKIVKYYK